jgi:NitT/TauT family transport system ATP-binding protein
MIKISELTFSYSGHPPIFEAFNWLVNRGEAWTVIGPSGCGKTTLLYLLAGLRRPDSGQISIHGKLISRPRPRSGLVLQDHGLLPWSTVRDNVRLGLTIWEYYGPDGIHAPLESHIGKDRADECVSRWLQKFGIDHLHSQFPTKLSRGQRQRVAIARTLVMEPDLLLLDEPFSALDAPTREDLQRMVIDLNTETDLTYILVTHDIEVAVAMGNKILALRADFNRQPQILENKNAGLLENRQQASFQKKCEELRALLGELT